MKVFGIGLSRTGTTSLAAALEILGLKANNYPDPRHVLTLSEQYDAMTDTPVIPYYKILDLKYPDARFVLTLRDVEGWMRSCRTVWPWHNPKYHGQPGLDNFRCVYGTENFDEGLFRAVWNAHLADVRAHFYSRPEKLLELDICGGEGWRKLCPFLGLPVPERGFPNVNKAEGLGVGVAVYTAIFGDYDTLAPVQFPDVPHYCFTDTPQGADGWQEIIVPASHDGGKLDALAYKTEVHRWLGHDVVIWQDGCGLLKQHPRKIAKLLGSNDIAAFAHPSRDCVYQEANAVVELGKAPGDVVSKQARHLRQRGYPERGGLHATGLVVRRQTQAVKKFNQEWWDHCRAFSSRDQLSFDCALWKQWLDIAAIPGNLWNNPYIDFRGHNE